MQDLAIKITIARVVLIPLFLLSYFLIDGVFGKWVSLIIYALAAVSDYLDGYIARTRNQVSVFGAFLDPVADKLMVVAVLIALLNKNHQLWLMLCSLLIISREIWISALREWLSGMGKGKLVAVSKVGKWKTTFQMLALGFLIYQYDFLGLPIWSIGQWLLLLATALTIYSMIDYTLISLRFLTK